MTAFERFKKLALASKLNVKHDFGQSIKEIYAYRAAVIRREQEPQTFNYENEPFKDRLEYSKNVYLYEIFLNLYFKYLHHERALNYRGYRMVVGLLEEIDDKKAVIVGEKKWDLRFGCSMADISKVPIGKIVLTQAKNFDGVEFICRYLAVFEDSHLTEISKVRPQLI